MNYKKACNILKINRKHLTKEVKQAYFRQALKYHPDKNPEDNGEKFKEVKEAYDYLTDEKNRIKIDEDIKYIDLIKLCIKFFSPDSNLENIFIDTSLDGILKDCQNISIDIFDKLSKNKAKQVFDFIYKFNNILEINEDLLQKFKKKLQKKMANDIIIILNPTENNLCNDQIFKLEMEEKEFYIPLWHHEIHFSLQDKDLIIKCEPELKKNMWIDHQNNIYILEKISIEKIFKQKFHEIEFGEKLFKIESKKLKITQEKQIIKIIGEGILKINEEDIFANSGRGDVIIEIYLE